MRLWLPQDVLGRREHYGHGVGGHGELGSCGNRKGGRDRRRALCM